MQPVAPHPQTNAMKARMAAGQLAVGMIVRLTRSVEIAAIGKSAGFDCLFIDLEHNSFSLDTVSQISMTATALGLTPLVRVPGLDAGDISRALEAGAQGIIVPHMESAEEARIAVDAALFPPLGSRSFVATSVHTLFRPGKAAEMMPRLNAEILIIGVIKSLKALENVEEIAAVPGLDVLLVGTNDLSNSMGLFGQLDDPQVIAAYERVAAACKAHGKHLGVGGLVSRPDLARSLITRLGATYATAGSDAAFLLNGSTSASSAFRQP